MVGSDDGKYVGESVFVGVAVGANVGFSVGANVEAEMKDWNCPTESNAFMILTPSLNDPILLALDSPGKTEFETIA